MATNVTSKGQVTVPKSVRDYLGLKPGVAVTFERLPSGEVVLRPAKRGIGVYEQVVDRLPGLAAVVADRHLDQNRDAISLHRFSDSGLESQRPVVQVGVVISDAGDRELVSTQTRDEGSLTSDRRKSASELEKHFIAAGSSERLVDLAEAGDVDQRDRRSDRCVIGVNVEVTLK